MRRVLGKVPSVPANGRGGSRTSGAKAPKPTHVNASSPEGHSINPQHIGGQVARNDWYKGDELVTYAVDKD